MSYSLPRRLGPAKARQLLMLPREIGGEESLALGLVDALVPAHSALAQAKDDARKITEGPPLALAGIKDLLAASGATARTTCDPSSGAPASRWAGSGAARTTSEQ
ncbi:MAG: enoyl-CoA hydratase/isomerase family protein [Myxococcaceae bacterium]